MTCISPVSVLICSETLTSIPGFDAERRARAGALDLEHRSGHVFLLAVDHGDVEVGDFTFCPKYAFDPLGMQVGT
jgi:hypothetical protein